MTGFLKSLIITGVLLLAGAIPVFAHGGEDEAFNAETSIKQTIITLDQAQPNFGVAEMKLQEIIDNKESAQNIEIANVEKALDMVKQEKYTDAKQLLFETIGQNPEGEDAKLGSLLLEYEKEFSPGQATYLLLAAAISFIAIGGLILKQSVRG